MSAKKDILKQTQLVLHAILNVSNVQEMQIIVVVAFILLHWQIMFVSNVIFLFVQVVAPMAMVALSVKNHIPLKPTRKDNVLNVIKQCVNSVNPIEFRSVNNVILDILQ